MSLTAAITKWSGGNSSAAYAGSVAKTLGISPDTVLTKGMLADPNVAVPLAKAMSRIEAGKDFPMSDDQWRTAHEMFKAGGAIPSTGPVNLKTDLAPSFAPAGTPEAAVEANKIAAYRPSPTLWRTVEAAADETTAAYLFRDSPVFTPAPDYKPTVEELDTRKQGLPEKYWDRLIGVSPAHSDYLTAQAKRQFENEVTLSEAGWTGTGIGLVSSILDPVDLAVGIASGGLGAFAGGAMKAGAIGQRLMAAGGAAAGNVGLTALGDAAGRATEGSDYAYAAAWGAGLGFAFGPLARNPATQDIADAGAYAANRAMTDIRRGTPLFSGGEGTLSAAPAAVDNVKLSGGDLMSIADGDVSRTAIESLRPDMAGRGGTSDNPLMRAVSQALGLDVVGRVGPDGGMAVNPFSAGEDKLRIMSTADRRLYSVAYPQFDEWAKARGVNWMKLAAPRLTQEWEDFASQVTAHRRDLRPERDTHYDPQVVKTSREMGAILEEHRQGNIAPRPETPSNPGRPLAGMENVPANPHYMPRVYRLDKILAIDATGRKFVEWLEGALLSAHKELGDKAEALARGLYSGLMRRGFNLDEFAMMARDGATADVIRSGMLDIGMSEADIADILARLPKGSKPGFTHVRLDIDETFVHPRTDLKLSDFTETNAFDLFDHYNHQASAWRAAGRMQIVRGDGEVLLDGIRSRKEISDVLQQVADKGYASGLTPKQIEDDTALLREMLDRLFGVPHDKGGTAVAQGAEIVRNLATMTSAGNFGLSALPDMARIATIGGLRAMVQQLPAFRTHILEGGVLRPRDDLAMDMAAFGAVDEFKHLSPRRVPEDGMLTTPMQGAMGKMAGVTKVLGDAVVHMSGMTIINARVRETARRVMASRFYRDAELAFTGSSTVDISRLPEAERNRLKWFGLSDDMLVRVLQQVREHGETTDSIWGAKLHRLHPDAWTDDEAKHAFTMSLNRAAGRASMEHDFGPGTVYDRSPIFRTFTQLRRFGLNAWHMNILHGRAMSDAEAFADVVWSTLAAASLYAVRTRIQAATQPDPERFLQERLTAGDIAGAAFQLGAYSSLIPALVDTGIGLTGANPLFGYRNSALPSDAWFGNPSVTFLNNLLRVAPSALFQPIIMGRERSQQEWRQMLSILPFQNNIAVQSALGLMVRDAPPYAPKSRGYSISEALMKPLQ
ncbi:hypothetical protein V5F32_08370 [Xanthobacter oligotrophicus]|uniref:Uncharacterized protein n=1 Tax=Xanthobacter oligotrophicus TaxID=2607286 RepID=A0ABW6ZWP2_9HYPH